MKKLIYLFAAALFCTPQIHSQMQTVVATPANDFLNSIGAVSSVSRRGETVEGSIESVRYMGMRWLRSGYEDNAPIEDFIRFHNETGALICYGLLSGHSDLERLLNDARKLAGVGALLSIEGLNEPNNWGITYQGEKGGAKNSWMAVARLQSDLYNAVKNDPVLKSYPVWMPSETGAQTDNVGMQFLTIPEGANTLMPAGTKYADYACCHNYISHPSWPGLHDNQAWLSSMPGKGCPVDGLYGNYGLTWAKKFPGYSEEELETLPRVTTETGFAISKKEGVTEEIQARLYLSIYLSQFKRGWKHTAIYLLKGRENEPEHESYAFYTLDYKPKLAAHYLHNFTAILADKESIKTPGTLVYSITPRPEAVHDLLLQKSDGTLALIVWGEKYAAGSKPETVEVKFDRKYSDVRIYNPAQYDPANPEKGVQPVQKKKNVLSVKLSMLDNPYIIEIK